MVRDVTDDQLIRAIALRDEQALAMLYERYATDIFRVARLLLAEQAAAEGVLEETFWQVWCRAAEVTHGKTAVSTWLYQTARQLAMSR